MPEQDPSFVTGREAAALLGVKRETLYAYASRGLLRSEPGEHGRERRYHREDLERLKARHDARSGHGPVAAGALRWGEPVGEMGTIADVRIDDLDHLSSPANGPEPARNRPIPSTKARSCQLLANCDKARKVAAFAQPM